MKIKELLKYRDELQNKVLTIIGYGSGDTSPIERCDNHWYINRTDLMIAQALKLDNRKYHTMMVPMNILKE